MKKKIVAVMLAAVMVFSFAACGSSSNSGSPSGGATNSEKQESQEPQQEEYAFEITYQDVDTKVDSLGFKWVKVIIEVENTGTKDLFLKSADVDLENEKGELVSSLSMVSAYPQVLQPGEKGYYFESTILDDVEDTELSALPHLDIEKSKVDCIRYEVSEFNVKDGSYGDLKMLGRVTNTTDKDESLAYVAAILFDAEGKPLTAQFDFVDVKAGDKVGFERTVEAFNFKLSDVASSLTYSYPTQWNF